MPELPELRVHAERLARSHSGSVLERFTPLSFTALKTFQPDPAAAVGTALTAVRTRGKYLIAEFGDLAFIVHLMQGGRLTPETGRARKPRGGLARWEFDGVASWLLTEAGHERRAGVWVVAGETEGNEPLDGLGPDADSVDEAALSAILAAAGGARLHGVLRDQRRIAGIGRRLANEICWAAELSPFAPSARLESEQRSALLAAIQRCIGASIEDEATRDTIETAMRDRYAARFDAAAGEIHIDHIVPVAAFSITSLDCDDFKRCWSLSNLRPLWAADNRAKGSKLEVII